MRIQDVKSPLREYCDERMISDSLRKAFGIYIRSEMGKKFKMDLEGETVHLMLSRITKEQMDEYWLSFVGELKKYLSTI